MITRFSVAVAALCAVVVFTADRGRCDESVSDNTDASTGEKTVASEPDAKRDPALDGMKLVYEHDFEDSKLHRYEPTDPSAWELQSVGDSRVLALIKRNSDFSPPVRSPLNRSLIRDLEVRSFLMDVRLKSTVQDYDHRSLCLFFGYQDDSHLYYVHFGKKTDDHANQIFIVNNEPRKKISTKTTAGTAWDDEWHRARIIRNADSGEIRVFFDDLTTPVMTASDQQLLKGRVGIGSFDDIGIFDNIRVYVPESEE
ncbi:MAG: hypothetical protein JNL58_15425 [Planctomyces sp.]|nr:hypothetical protein [Planctomyces sp.]